MEDLIKALQIFLKYKNSKYPTQCEHDQLSIMDISLDMILEEDIKELEQLGFLWSDSDDCFISFKYGSA